MSLSYRNYMGLLGFLHFIWPKPIGSWCPPFLLPIGSCWAGLLGLYPILSFLDFFKAHSYSLRKAIPLWLSPIIAHTLQWVNGLYLLFLMGISFSLGPCLGHVYLLYGLLGHIPIVFLFHFLVSSLNWFGLFLPLGLSYHWAFGSILAKISINNVQLLSRVHFIHWVGGSTIK